MLIAVALLALSTHRRRAPYTLAARHNIQSRRAAAPDRPGPTQQTSKTDRMLRTHRQQPSARRPRITALPLASNSALVHSSCPNISSSCNSRCAPPSALHISALSPSAARPSPRVPRAARAKRDRPLRGARSHLRRGVPQLPLPPPTPLPPGTEDSGAFATPLRAPRLGRSQDWRVHSGASSRR